MLSFIRVEFVCKRTGRVGVPVMRAMVKYFSIGLQVAKLLPGKVAVAGLKWKLP
jgi:hypothetical protein